MSNTNHGISFSTRGKTHCDTNTEECCLDRYFSRKLRSMGVLAGPASLMDLDMQKVLRAWVGRLPLTNASLEFRMAQQRLLTPNKCTNWNRFVSRSLCREVSAYHMDESAELMQGASLGDGNTDSQETPAKTSDRNARRMAPLLCFHQRCLAKARAENPRQKVNGASKAFWDHVKQLWASLPEDHPDKALAHLDSDASAADAAQRRLRAKRGDPPIGWEAGGGQAIVERLPAAIDDRPCPMSVAHALLVDGDPQSQLARNLLPEEIAQITSSRWPVSLAWFKENRRTNVSLHACAAKARSDFRHISRKTEEWRDLEYDKPCRGFCARAVPNDLKQLQSFFLLVLERMLKQAGPSCLLEFKHQSPAIEPMRVVWFISAWSPRSGLNEFRCAAIPCDSVAPDVVAAASERYAWQQPDGEGRLLQLARRPHTPPPQNDSRQVRAAFVDLFTSCSHLPPFDMRDHDELAVAVLGQSTDVEVRVLVYEAVGWDLFWAGQCCGHGMSVGVVNQAAMSAGRPSSTVSSLGGFLAPPTKRQRTVTPRPSAMGESGELGSLEQLLEELLDDAALADMQELREADAEARAHGERALQHDRDMFGEDGEEKSDDESDGVDEPAGEGCAIVEVQLDGVKEVAREGDSEHEEHDDGQNLEGDPCDAAVSDDEVRFVSVCVSYLVDLGGGVKSVPKDSDAQRIGMGLEMRIGATSATRGGAAQWAR